MPKTKRDILKRNMAQALNNSAKAVLQIDEIRKEFEGVHEEEAKILAAIQITIAQQRENLIAFSLKAWGLDEEGLASFV